MSLTGSEVNAGGGKIALVMDDLGTNLPQGERALALPGPIAYAFLPHTPYADTLAKRAHRQGKQVMVHLPMESVAGSALGPGGLTLHMTREQVARTVTADFDAIPHATGVNNHMGSLLTRHPGYMRWIMEDLRVRPGWFFLDSRTTAATVAARLANEMGIPHTSRDVFLDPRPAPKVIGAEFQRLRALAQEQGTAVAIAHPYPETLRFLEAVLPRLEYYGLDLVPLTDLTTEPAASSPWQPPSDRTSVQRAPARSSSP